MTYVIQLTGGSLDGVKFLSPIPFDEIRLSRVVDDGSEPTVFYECDWEESGKMAGTSKATAEDAIVLNFVPGDLDRGYAALNRPEPAK